MTAQSRLAEIRAEAERRPRREHGQTKVDELLAEIDRLQEREMILASACTAAVQAADRINEATQELSRALLIERKRLEELDNRPVWEPSHAH